MYLLAVTAAFVLAAIWFYPLTLLLRYEQGLRLYWLPRVFMGFARPRRIPGRRVDVDAHKLDFKLYPRILWHWDSRLIHHLDIWDWFFYAAPGFGFHGQCIFSLYAGDIIKAFFKAKRRNKHGRRT